MSMHRRFPTNWPRRLSPTPLALALFAAVAAHAGTGADDADAVADPQQAAPQRTAAQKSSAAANNSSELATIVVTAQKKEENIQKVPIAITAFSGEDLINRKIETGGDLVTATPNVSFTKTNFAMYNFQIRGIGTQALSVTTDPAVAVSFNSSPMIRNRLFEQEYFDVSNVEVLRGPQGTLFGRNATAGVVNMIPNLPNFDGFEAWIKPEVGNYDSKRFSGMVNLPISDTLAFRAAGAWTDRSGYIENTVTGQNVDGRNLFSTRASLAWKPNDSVNASLVWEHFYEHDNRARTGKQLCHTDTGTTSVNGVATSKVDSAHLNRGCLDGSLYGDSAYGVPNGSGLPWILAASTAVGQTGANPNGTIAYAITPGTDPFQGLTQSKDLRKIATTYDPQFRAKNDIVQFNFDAEVGKGLKFVSQTLFTRDSYYSTQDYARFQSNPIFNATDNVLATLNPAVPAYNILPNGVYCDPQLGCSNRQLMVDLNTAYSKQWSQEFRLQSSYDGPFNFSVGANYLYYEINENYYAFNNIFTLLSQSYYNRSSIGSTPITCSPGQPEPVAGRGCIYIDPNPIGQLNGQGHNYFRSWNVADTRSVALFGEAYWQFTDTLKLTAGLRVTDDRKTTTPIPSQALLTTGFAGGGTVNSGYPALPDIHQSWTEPTGRLVLNWTPQTSFTDSTLVYASYSRGYKAGGTNSPGVGADPQYLYFAQRDPRYKPEFVNAFELGTKNVLAGGKLTVNAALFYNDYKNYQVSQIEDRATLNENFDAKTWGAELEVAWKPVREFQLSGALGLLGTRVGPNQYSIDPMNRTQGNPDWVLVRPWMQQASNCIAPAAIVAKLLQFTATRPSLLFGLCGKNPFNPGFGPGSPNLRFLGGVPYDPLVDAPNGGQGFAANVGGNSLPNAPHITLSISPQYTFFFDHSNLTLRADMYYQGESWARIYQDKIDRLHDWGNVNVSATWYQPESDLTVQLYVKNALNGKAITGTFLNSDDTGLTSNVFIQDPRIIGLSLRKGFY
ncbi:TonB-dependent receptor [Rudaea sp. 3F27F6]|uniref:TonB-dependent receptor n=1 Tax=Rudaea sp. 3F27F6 TaxID=2502208 RepID=UPI001BB1CAF3|nr:TonB-dependent receptor [Rudaea sp. 3F27F6]